MSRFSGRDIVLAVAVGALLLAPAPSPAGNIIGRTLIGGETLHFDEPTAFKEVPQLSCQFDITVTINNILAGTREDPFKVILDAIVLTDLEVVKGARFFTESKLEIIETNGSDQVVLAEILLNSQTLRQRGKPTKRWELEYDPRADLSGPLADNQRAHFSSYIVGLKKKKTDRASHFCQSGG